jgi:hypothetical protein
MRQEVEITIRGDFDITMSKKEISHLVKEILNASPIRREIVLKVIKVREEAEIYETE